MMVVTGHITDNFTKLINPDGLLGLIGVGLISNQQLQGGSFLPIVSKLAII